MAIFKSVINVNNGNTGWTRQHVMDALETAFSQLGYNGGSPTAGVPVYCVPPGRTAASGLLGIGDVNWKYCGGPAVATRSNINRYFYVTNNGTSSYNLLEQWFTSSVSTANDTLTLTNHLLQTGDPVVWNPDSLSGGITPLANNTTYYVIKVDSNTIKLAETLDDATNGIPKNLSATSGSWNLIPLRRAFNVLYNNYQIDVEMGDILNFTINDTTSGGNFFLIDSPSTGYAANRVLNTTNYESQSYQVFPTGQGTSSVTWQVRGWAQTETENPNVQDVAGSGDPGTRSYGYGNSANPTMRGFIRILPSVNNNNYSIWFPYWKYTIPASDGRSSLKLRVYRFPDNYGDRGKIAGVSIVSIGSGWSANDSFTIPGSAIGGTDITNDILFGVNSATTNQQTNGTGVASILTTNFGSGSSMYQKHPQGYFGVVKIVNDNTKTFGTTYYGIGLSNSNNYRMYLNSGPVWANLNTLGTNSVSDNGNYEYGVYGGDRGLDYQEIGGYANTITNADNNVTYLDYATTSTPTAYPLSIRLYRAQSPQDTNFAVIQFTQTINNAIVPFATFSIHKGPNFGSNIWDLNHVWNGGYTQYGTTSRGIITYHRVASRWNYSQYEGTSLAGYSLGREANFGYLRNTSTTNVVFPSSIYQSNIDTWNYPNSGDYYNTEDGQVITYYRNSTYDIATNAVPSLNYADRLKSVSSSANYYKPMKGIPISNQLMPCPYYIPDDYILLQVSTSPGLTEFRPGDTITVSPSEIYEVIIAGYQTSQNGLDNINNNSSIGMVFAARTT